MLKMEDVSFTYNNNGDTQNLSDINLNVKEGEVILLCGESGCGKTSITRFLNGLIPNFFDGKREGNVYLGNDLISEMKIYEISKHIGSVFQNPKTQFFNVDTTSELVFGCENLSMNVDEIKKRLDCVVDDFDIFNLVDKNIFKLSGGEKQKIACASVSAVSPDVLVLDEPSSNLDSKSSWDFEFIIRKWKEQKKTVIIAEHKLFFLGDVVDRVIFLKDGKITNEWSIDEFKNINHRDLGLRQLNLDNIELKRKEYYSKNQEFLELKNFKFNYGKTQVLDIDDVKIPKNEIIAIIGKNGAGKSTFANCLCGLKKSCKGELVFNGKSLKRKDRLKKSYMVMQDVNHQLFTESVLDEVLLSMDEDDLELAEDILRNLNLIHLKDAHPMALSGGEKQRVAIASAIASKKEILIFDEPTSGLDLRNMMKVSENLRYLQGLGITSFIITHDFELICESCSHILHFDDGKIIDNYKIDEQKLKDFFLRGSQ
ncbi:ABC transporter [Methanobrevibacter sp. YE315]|uniref:ABC transporter ATP-binding protein n=1 Tax=Methanobrevibacter sp. YE315 TaxID=1609968 RepID=UPI000764ED6F|nr:ABC transporter [Methanobrevibacter sp. YE315]